MKSVRPALAAGTVAAFFFIENSVLPQARSQQGLSADLQNALVRHLIGMSVENLDGEKLGKVKNFAIDMRSGQAKYVVISSGGVVGIRSHARIVPVQAVSTATAKKGVASLDISKQRWAKAPAFKKGDLSGLVDPAWQNQISQFYSSPTQGIGQTGRPVSRSSRERETQEQRLASRAISLRLAKDVLGKEIINPQRERIGEVSDLLVNLAEQRPAFAILAAGRSSPPKQTFAVPLRSLTTVDGGKFMLDANPKMFEEARLFNDRVWRATSTSNAGTIYRFELR